MRRWHGLVTIADTDEWGDVSESDQDQIMLAWEAHMTDLCSQVLDKARLVYLAARVAELLNRHGLTDGES